MEKRKWPWKKKPSERSPGDSESSGSFSSHSERYSDEQEVLRESPNDSSKSPEVTSKEAALMEEEVKETVKSLTEKLSAALVNISAKEDLVKQHAKVAEEAVAGWEKAENEVTTLQHQLESALRNQNLEVRANHLEKQISDAIQHQRKEWDAKKSELENQILCLQAEIQKPTSSLNPDTLLTLKSLERENSSLKQELRVMTIERDLSTRAAENASRLQLESIKKIAKFEAECRRLQSIARKSTHMISSQKSFGVSSFNADSITDNNSCMSSNTGSEQNCSPKNPTVEIDMMDDFLEMERLALSETIENNTMDSNPLRPDTDVMAQRIEHLEIELKKMEKENMDLKNALDKSEDSLQVALRQMADGEIMLGEMEKEIRAIQETKELLELQLAGVEVEARTLSGNVVSLKMEIEEERKLSARLTDKCRELEGTLSGNAESLKAEIEEERKLSTGLTAKCQELEGALSANVESLKTEIEEERKLSAGLTAKCRELEGTLSVKVESLKTEIEEERKLSAGLTAKCRELEAELIQRIQESQVEENTGLDVEPKIKEEDLAVAADKLAECQKTIASLGRQLDSLATLEDFLIDTSNIPGFSKANSPTGGEMWRSPYRDYSDVSRKSSMENHRLVDDSLQTAAKNRNGFAKFFSRSKTVNELENCPA